MTLKYLWVTIVAVVLLIMASDPLNAQTGGTATIGGSIFTGSQNPDGTPNTTTAAPLNGASVMVQNMHSGGAFVTYGGDLLGDGSQGQPSGAIPGRPQCRRVSTW